MKKILNYIDGNLSEAKSGVFIENFNPAYGTVYSLIADSDEIDVQLAYTAANKAFPKWAFTDKKQKSKILLRIAKLLGDNIEKFAEAESIDNGKPLSLARDVDIPRAIENFEFFGTGLLHFSSESHHMEDKAINYTLRQPIGVVGCISPWNLPLYLFSWKIAPALAAGNTVIAKPSEITPMTAFLLSEICIEAGLPAGVLNIVHGDGPKVGEAIVKHPQIKAISFTGGSVTGAHIAKIAGPMFKKLSLELGGKNPNIIFEDCNFDLMLETTVKSSFRNQGEICLCGSRIFVQESIYERFKRAFVEKTNQLVVGDPSDPQTDLGAIVSKEHFEKILSYIELAKEEKGTILSGGGTVSLENELAGGWYMRPTIIEGLDYRCRTNQEEIFGPVVTIMPFSTEEEVISYANSVRYGLSATLWTQDLTRAHRVASLLDSGIIWINCWMTRDLRTPFGGMKDSGIGREGGWEIFKFFTESKNVTIQLK